MVFVLGCDTFGVVSEPPAVPMVYEIDQNSEHAVSES